MSAHRGVVATARSMLEGVAGKLLFPPSVRPGRCFLLTGWVQLSEEVERAPEALIGGKQGAG